MLYTKRYLLLLLAQVTLICTVFSQTTNTIDEFMSNSSYYSSFNSGIGTVNTSLNNNDFSSGNSSLNINYTFTSANGAFFSVLRNYTTTQQDYSFLTTGFSIDHKGGDINDKISIRLWEDINGNGVFDGEDEVFESSDIATGNSNWKTSFFDITAFTKVTGNGNGQIELNRIRAWDIKISNSSSITHSNNILIDNFQLHSNYNPQNLGTSKLTGSFIQLWNTTGCKCGEWEQERWDAEFKKMKQAQLDYLVVQYSVYDNLSWYSPSNIPSVIYKMSTLNRMVAAAEKFNMKIHFGLYFDETWNSSNKSLASTYSSILNKHKTVANELWTLFGNSPAFGGWYIPQELNDLEWQNDNEKTLLFNWIKDVTDYTESLSANYPIMIAPFFNLWQPADKLETWYNELLSISTNLDRIYPQDGVGITLKNPDYHIPLYFSAIKRACDNHNKTFGATIESFHQTSGWPINNGTFSATSTDIEILKKQLWAVNEQETFELIQFSWSYMQPDLTPQSTQLYDDYSSYLADISLISNTNPINDQDFSVYPNPTSYKIFITSKETLKKVRLYSTNGVLLLNTESKQIDLSSLQQGIYILEIEFDEHIAQRKIIKR
ncbi:MAG: DUF4434 domain-containing protein [Cytophagales bacterium]|nr:DUF4434 domain-containing protein [Cytophagales bacterium]